jgi:hypothetical protein
VRTVKFPICIAAATAISAIASSAHAGPGQVTAHAARWIERIASDQIKSKSPCAAEHPPSYCKRKKGSG